jgi:FAD/FMN-containing dehydrogenase
LVTDAGVLHVRPALDMCDPQQEVLMKRISDDVVALTAKYGGLLWGEHGKGFRAEQPGVLRRGAVSRTAQSEIGV